MEYQRCFFESYNCRKMMGFSFPSNILLYNTLHRQIEFSKMKNYLDIFLSLKQTRIKSRRKQIVKV